MHQGVAPIRQPQQCLFVLQGADDGLHAEWDQCGGGFGRAGKRANADAAPTEMSAEMFADKTCRASYGDQAARSDQAEATLRRSSSATAFRCSRS